MEPFLFSAIPTPKIRHCSFPTYVPSPFFSSLFSLPFFSFLLCSSSLAHPLLFISSSLPLLFVSSSPPFCALFPSYLCPLPLLFVPSFPPFCALFPSFVFLSFFVPRLPSAVSVVYSTLHSCRIHCFWYCLLLFMLNTPNVMASS